MRQSELFSSSGVHSTSATGLDSYFNQTLSVSCRRYPGKLVVYGLVGEKWEEKKKLGDLSLFAIPSPVQPSLGLMFDILIFKYQKLNVQTIKEWKTTAPEDKGLTNPFNLFFST